MGKKRTFNRPQRHQTKIRLVSVYGQAPCLTESCPENGNLPKLPLLTIGGLVPSVGTKSRSQKHFWFSGAAQHFAGPSDGRAS